MTSASQILHFERLSPLNGLSPLRELWKEMAVPHPFLDWRWLSSWWSTFGGKHTLFLIIGYQESAVRLVAPWYFEDSLARGREIRFLGSGRACSDYMTVLQHPDNNPDLSYLAIEGLAEFVARDQSWDTINFDGVQQDDHTMNLLVECLRRRKIETRSEPTQSTWRLNLPQTWEAYVDRCRKKIRQKFRRVQRNTEGRSKFRMCDNHQRMSGFFETFAELHAQRHIERNGDQGCFDTEAFEEFLHNASRQFMSDDSLRLGQLDIDGVPVASCLAFEFDDTLYFYQCGSNPSFKRMQPGWLLNVKLIQWAIDRGLRTIDYLRGDEPYKSRLSARPFPQQRLLGVANHLTSKTRDRLWQTARSIKQTLTADARPFVDNRLTVQR